MAEHLDAVFAFLGQIQADAQLRASLNEVCTADEVAAIAAQRGFSFTPATLLELFQRCNEAPVARSGLIRVYLQRAALS